MKILALQLKRIGDLILTTPALAALREAYPSSRITLAVMDACGDLLPAIPSVDEGVIFRRGEINGSAWKKIALQRFDVCLDFAGNDRSAFLTALSNAHRRAAFAAGRSARIRSLVYNHFVDSAVREHHTADHYLHLLQALPISATDAGLALRVSNDIVERADTLLEELTASTEAQAGNLGRAVAIVHPGTARPEKYWVAERWAAVITHLRDYHGLQCVITGSADRFEQEHIAEIQRMLPRPCRELVGQLDLLTFAAIIAQARLCVSCDTATVHLAAAFQRPQIALYGPTNPFHWRPRHGAAIVLSAASPEEPMRDFSPRMKGAPMRLISTEAVIRATDALLAAERL